MDCLDGLRRLPDASIDCVVTDPPYRLTQHGSAGNTGGIMGKPLYGTGKVFTHNDIDIEEYLPELYRVLKDGTHCYIMCNHRNLTHFLRVIDESGFHFIKCLIWDKAHKIMGKFYMNRFEYILLVSKGRERPVNDCGRDDIIRIPNVREKKSGQNIHDCQKPVSLMQVLIENSTRRGEIVLDPFMGSGTTALASHRIERHYIGFEIDKVYYDLAMSRIRTSSCQLDLFE